jgi:calcineurin-like phosphoesterase family protein
MSVYIEPISLRVTPEHNVFAVSDTHFGHDRDFIYTKRGTPPYKSVIEHDAGVIKQWNEKATNKDTVLHFGDFMFGKGGLERIMQYFNVLNFETLFLMPGNHHAGIKQLIAEHGVYDAIQIAPGKFVVVLPNYAEFFVNGQAIVASHYPISSWNGMAHGSWCLSGHCHGSFPGSQLNNPHGKVLDLGIEVCGGLLSFDEIKQIMNKKTLKLVDHHNPSTNNPFN